eukprot:3951200-Amphidinium_carterae.1
MPQQEAGSLEAFGSVASMCQRAGCCNEHPVDIAYYTGSVMSNADLPDNARLKPQSLRVSHATVLAVFGT